MNNVSMFFYFLKQKSKSIDDLLELKYCLKLIVRNGFEIEILLQLIFSPLDFKNLLNCPGYLTMFSIFGHRFEMQEGWLFLALKSSFIFHIT